MKRVEIESPYAGDVETNLAYLRRAMRDCLLRGEAPIASHALYTQAGVLDDDVPEERQLGMEAGKAWTPCVDLVVVYCDFGLSTGMCWGINQALLLDKEVEFRSLKEDSVVRWVIARQLDGQWPWIKVRSFSTLDGVGSYICSYGLHIGGGFGLFGFLSEDHANLLNPSLCITGGLARGVDPSKQKWQKNL